MISNDAGADNTPGLGREQLEIYAAELSGHFWQERRLLQELAERNRELEQSLREFTAQNRLGIIYLTQYLRQVYDPP